MKPEVSWQRERSAIAVGKAYEEADELFFGFDH